MGTAPQLLGHGLDELTALPAVMPVWPAQTQQVKYDTQKQSIMAMFQSAPATAVGMRAPAAQHWQPAAHPTACGVQQQQCMSTLPVGSSLDNEAFFAEFVL